MEESLKDLSRRVRACRLCEAELPLGPRPVFRAGSSARILIASQAPGTKVHESGIPFDDPSGDRLRDWMGIDSEAFYNVENIAIIPMGLCYPGKGDWGDLPPTKRCAPTWRQALLDQMPGIKLVIAVGLFAVRWHLPEARGSLTKIVQEYSPLSGDVVPLPHPSPRNNIWLSKNRWFETEVVPILRKRVADVLGLEDG
ncbi:MAG TPA: uracil-DNA glycosylase family protein [Xanthomonadales bacterium]|nr:uracil-DNA glycosylase family protein [Xanthomonadales bacterium]